jgi:hypothetical protein
MRHRLVGLHLHYHCVQMCILILNDLSKLFPTFDTFLNCTYSLVVCELPER